MFEAALFRADVNVAHLVLAVVSLSIATAYVLDRTTRLQPMAMAGFSILITQLLAGQLLVLLRSTTAQPVHDGQTWIAHYLAYFNAVVVWCLCPIFAAPAAILVTALLKTKRSAGQ